MKKNQNVRHVTKVYDGIALEQNKTRSSNTSRDRRAAKKLPSAGAGPPVVNRVRIRVRR